MIDVLGIRRRAAAEGPYILAQADWMMATLLNSTDIFSRNLTHHAS